MAEFEIRIKDLEAGRRDFQFPVRLGWLATSLEVDGLSPVAPEGRLSATADLAGTDVVFQGKVDAHVQAECARCLGPAELHLRSTFSVIYTKGAIDPESADSVEPYQGDLILADAFVREALLLEVPIQPLCRQDCPGLPLPNTVREPEPEKIDPRFRVLSKLTGPKPD